MVTGVVINYHRNLRHELANLSAPPDQMRRIFLNALLCIFACWFALLDHCLIVSAEMPISSEVSFLLVLQAVVIGVVILSANDCFGEFKEMVISWNDFRMQFLIFVLPVIFLLLSPALISGTMYGARYGLDKFVVRAHVASDLACCLNPFSERKKN